MKKKARKMDAGAVIAKIRAIGTEFSEVSDEELMVWIGIVSPFVNWKMFGPKYELALAYLACHKMKMAGLGDSSTGSLPEGFHLSSYSEGSVSVSYSGTQSQGTQIDAEYAMTIYGMQFLQIRRSSVMSIMID